MKKFLLALFLILLFWGSAADEVQLERGWNTFSVNDQAEEDDLLESTCEFEPVEGTENYFYEQESPGDYSPVDELKPWNAYYGWVSKDCTLELEDDSEWSETVELDSGEWNLISIPPNDDLESLVDRCDLSRGDLESWFWAERGSSIFALNNKEDYDKNTGVFV